MSKSLSYSDVEFEAGRCGLCDTAPAGEPPVLTGRDEIWEKEGEVLLVACGACGHIYQSPRPTPGTMRYYYEDCYSGEAQEKMRKFQLESGGSKLMSWYRLAVIEKVRKIKAGETMLDVGCSYGGFIEYARLERRVTASAIDLDPGSIEKFVNTQDIDVRCGDLLDTGYPTDHFDYVTLYETLEHIYEPVETLKEIQRILKPGGLATIEVPNWDALTRRMFGPSWFPLLLPTHLQHFSRAHLKQCAKRAGLEPVRLESMWYPTEVTVSLWIMVTRVLGRPKEKSLARKLLEVLLGIGFVFVFFFVDIPFVLALTWFGLSGHQTLIAMKPIDSDA